MAENHKLWLNIIVEPRMIAAFQIQDMNMCQIINTVQITKFMKCHHKVLRNFKLPIVSKTSFPEPWQIFLSDAGNKRKLYFHSIYILLSKFNKTNRKRSTNKFWKITITFLILTLQKLKKMLRFRQQMFSVKKMSIWMREKTK